MITCPNCGAQNAPGARYCSNCAQPLPAAPAQQAYTPPPPQAYAPPPVYATPGPAPSPPGGLSGAAAAIIAFLVVGLIGGAVWFFALRPKASGATPGTGPGPQTTLPTDPPVSPTDPGPSPTTSPADGASFGIQLCTAITEGSGCASEADTIPITDTGWQVPVGQTDTLLYVYLTADNLKSGDQVTMTFVDPATGLEVTSVPFDPVAADDNYWFYSYFNVSAAHRGKSLEVIVRHNGTPVTGWERPNIMTFV